jgi:hypoxia up-regulated 1
LAERHYPLRPAYNETRSGTTLTVDGHAFTPEELVAMVLTHAIDISVAHAEASGKPLVPPPRDVVLTVPSYATQVERQALLDAASVAGLNVLQLIEETTSAALQYAMEKSFTPEKGGDQIMLFYNMGASAVQVAVVRFYQDDIPQPYGKPKSVPALQVLSKAWDYTMGGEAFDHLIVEYLADQFNIHWHASKKGKKLEKNADVRSDPRAMTKLRLQANKIKHVLSANLEIPIFMDSLHDDTSLSLTMTRTKLDELAQPLLDRAVAPIRIALKQARRVLKSMNYTRSASMNTTINETDATAAATTTTTATIPFDWDKNDFLTGVELIGGGMRIPAVQQAVAQVLPAGMELGLHMNGDESMALGAAFCGANISTAFRVRPVGMTDCHAFAQQITLKNINDVNDKKSSNSAGGEAPWSKQAVIFKAWGKMGVKKTIAFSHDEDVHCALDYVVPEPSSDGDDDGDVYVFPKGTDPALERFNLTGIAAFAKDMAEKGLLNTTEDGKQAKPKVTLQFELSPSGITSLVKAEVTVTETYMGEDEIVVEVDDDEEEGKNATDTNTTDANVTADDTTMADDANATTADDTNSTEEDKDVNSTAKDKKKAEKPKKKKKTIKVEKVSLALAS